MYLSRWNTTLCLALIPLRPFAMNVHARKPIINHLFRLQYTIN